MEKIVKINLGCGNDYRKGYLNIDNGLMFLDAKVDMKGDIKTFETAENSVNEILLSHVAMYLRPEELESLLQKIYQWLKVGGTIEIETINFDQVLDFAKQNDKAFGLDCIFGTEKTGPHKWGWNITRLRDLVIKSGFKKIIIKDGSKNPRRDFKIIATK